MCFCKIILHVTLSVRLVKLYACVHVKWGGELTVHRVLEYLCVLVTVHLLFSTDCYFVDFWSLSSLIVILCLHSNNVLFVYGESNFTVYQPSIFQTIIFIFPTTPPVYGALI